MKKTIVSIVLCLCLLASLSVTAFAAGNAPAGHVTLSVEKFILGQGYITRPVRVPFYAGETVKDVTQRVMGDAVTFKTGDYVSAFYDGLSDAEAAVIAPPDYVLAELGRYSTDTDELVDTGRQTTGWLAENDYYDFFGMGGASGWMYCVNNLFPNVGTSATAVRDGDVIRWQYTLVMGVDIGSDMGVGIWGPKIVFSPANRDALTALAARAAEKGLDGPAYDNALATLADIESGQAALSAACEALAAALPAAGGQAFLSLPQEISAAAGTQFNAVLGVNSWQAQNAKAVEGVLTLPEGLSLVELTAEPMSGGSLNYHVEAGTLRFVYISTDLKDVAPTAAETPYPLLTLTLRLDGAPQAETPFTLRLDSLRVLTRSDAEAVAYGGVSATTTAVLPVSAVARRLYAGDGTDLIPADRQAVAVDFVNLGGTPGITFGGSTLHYSAELSAVHGTTTYVALVNSALTLEALSNAAAYQVDDEAGPAAIRFADTDSDGVVNAQDALNTLAVWLRKTAAPDDAGTLVMNVTADGALNTADVLAMVEHYVDGTEFAVLGK